MLSYFPKYCSTRAIACYFVTLFAVSLLFLNRLLPFQFVLFGAIAVSVFFGLGHKVTQDWQRGSSRLFAKRLFLTALAIRVVYVIFVYFYYIEMTGEPHMYHAGDEMFYQYLGSIWRQQGFSEMQRQVGETVTLSDSGYPWWLGFEYLLLGTHVLPARMMKCVLDAFSCVLIYRLAQRNFGESTGRMAGVFCMLLPNMWYYCGITLKETEMVFLVILFVERADNILHAPKVKIEGLIIPFLCILAMFAFRTPLALVMAMALAIAMVFTSGRQLQMWKKILYGIAFAIWMSLAVGTQIVQETQQLLEQRTENQSIGYEQRAIRTGGNVFFKYVTGATVAPLVFTIPFPTMVHVEGQENQMMLNGANFIKNVMSGFTIFALALLLISGEWRKHILPLALMGGYLMVIAFSNFAHSERFHFPVLALEMMFAAYGVSQMQNKHKRWFMLWLLFVLVANVGWAWIKLRGRGLA